MLRGPKIMAIAIVVVTFLAIFKSGLAYAVPMTDADQAFIALREAARKNSANEATDLAARLHDYPIPSYVEYYHLKPQMKGLPEREIRAFLKHYAGTAIADRLRNDWLIELGKQRKWRMFDQQYPQFVLQDDSQLKCYALMSRAAKGQWVSKQARALLAQTKRRSDGCTALIEVLYKRRQFKRSDVWAQIRLATERGDKARVVRLATLVGANAHKVARAFKRSRRMLKLRSGKRLADREVFLIAVSRTAKVSVKRAERALNRAFRKLRYRERAYAWSQIARAASIDLLPKSVTYWKRAGAIPLSRSGHQWKVRAALRAGKWRMVKSSIRAMPKNLREQPTWVYWLGRAYLTTGSPKRAKRLFRSIAKQRHFYGQLAREELGGKTMIPARAKPASEQEIERMASKPEFQRALKMFSLNLRHEGLREWNWALRSMKEHELLAVAEFARRKQVLDRMVSTSNRTKNKVDFSQRFPSPFRKLMLSATRKLGLDMAWVYGLIRQESRFIMNAQSHAGASGLMQVMPGTAKLVARKIGLKKFHLGQLHEMETNILLGTNYLKMMHEEANGSQVMASAAYNAGPNRLRIWLAKLKRPVEGAIFAETIPFYETRTYVKNVMSNATYYAALFKGVPQSLKARLATIRPG